MADKVVAEVKAGEVKVEEVKAEEDEVEELDIKEIQSNKANDRIRQLAKENKDLKTQKALEDANRLKETNDFKTLYETEHAQYEKLKNDYLTSTMKNKFILAAQKLNIIDPDLAFRALEDYKDLYTVEENGNVLGFDKVLAALIKDKPYLIGTKKEAPLTSTSGKVTATAEHIYTAEEIKGMSYEEKKKFANVIEEQMKKGLIK